MALPRQNTVSPLLIRWSRVRISPDPPVTQRDHSDVVPFLLVDWNVMVTDWAQSEVYWSVMSGDGERWWTDETISIS